VGYFLSGPIPHQIIVSNWFRKNRGKAMGVLYVAWGGGEPGREAGEAADRGAGLPCGAHDHGGLVMLVWPLALLVLRDRPAEMGLYPDGAATPAAEVSAQPRSFRSLIGRYSFWLLVAAACARSGRLER